MHPTLGAEVPEGEALWGQMPKGRTLRSEVADPKRSAAGFPQGSKAPFGWGARGGKAPAKPRGAQGLEAPPEGRSALPRMACHLTYFDFHDQCPRKYSPQNAQTNIGTGSRPASRPTRGMWEIYQTKILSHASIFADDCLANTGVTPSASLAGLEHEAVCSIDEGRGFCR
jgi:hypothetical protein